MMKSKISRNLARLLAGFLLLASPAFGQSTVQNHAVPIGKGPGVSGFGSALPGTLGWVMTSQGPSADPVFAALPTTTVPGFATAAQYMAGVSASTIIPPSIIYPNSVGVTYGTTVTFDFSTFINAAITLTGNITTMTLTNVINGKSGIIQFNQDTTGGRTTVWNSAFRFSGGVQPTLTTTPNAVDILSYTCIASNYCIASLLKDVR
jgi:hypothetical protein